MYVGQTTRQLSIMLQEHKHAVGTADINVSVLAEHAWNHHHPIELDKATVLTSKFNLHRRLTLESWCVVHNYLEHEKTGSQLFGARK